MIRRLLFAIARVTIQRFVQSDEAVIERPAYTNVFGCTNCEYLDTPQGSEPCRTCEQKVGKPTNFRGQTWQ